MGIPIRAKVLYNGYNGYQFCNNATKENVVTKIRYKQVAWPQWKSLVAHEKLLN